MRGTAGGEPYLLYSEDIVILEIWPHSDKLRTDLLGIHSGKTRHAFGSAPSPASPRPPSTQCLVSTWHTQETSSGFDHFRSLFLWSFFILFFLPRVSPEPSLSGFSLSFVSASALKLMIVSKITFEAASWLDSSNSLGAAQ